MFCLALVVGLSSQKIVKPLKLCLSLSAEHPHIVCINIRVILVVALLMANFNGYIIIAVIIIINTIIIINIIIIVIHAVAGEVETYRIRIILLWFVIFRRISN